MTTGSISINDVIITEGNAGTKTATFTLTRSGGIDPFAISFATADNTATAGSDYVATAGTISFGSGVNTATIPVTINGDSTPESDETFFVNLSGATNGGTISDAQGQGTIVDDDSVGSIAINDVNITEGNAGTKTANFTLTRSGGTAAFAISFATADNTATAGSDYVATAGTISFGSGVNTATIPVTINGDITSESDETFFVNLSGATNGGIISDAQGQGKIADDDPPLHLVGTPGPDSYTALAGSERIDALGGTDTITFGFRLIDATVSYIGNTVVIDGPGGSSHTMLTGFEVFVFTDGTIHHNDADPLVDDLFYFSKYHDVWNAHVDADAHFHSIGWKEGRDPDAFFSTMVYLSANPDVKAAGVDALVHFDTIGWKQGRVPSITFDPAAYLTANADVAAANIDPLRHYLANGYQEGRQPIAPTDLLTANGFDYVYYLAHNPDVAAAGVDPLQHFQTFGWKEGRNPNALFDTNGYLANYLDVKAANVNPLDHYNQSGWKEGRDPSVNFDTMDYLSHYTDVANAHINPLIHFLQYGQAEARSAFADGHFG
jgi:hypothetical protein